MAAIERHWYRRTAVSLLLLPLGVLYCLLALLRRALYSAGALASVHVGRPVIVVGNITVGGSGKTPLVVWVARFLAGHGYRPGIVTRGYRGESSDWPQIVRADSDPALVGDEPVLLARRAACPVVADPQRVHAARLLIERFGCNVIVSDDGLQHYRLARDFEIAVLDGVRRLGNGWCLPAGPLREPPHRLASVDACVTHGVPQGGELGMQLVESGFLSTRGEAASTAFGGQRVHAVAGIGNPARFFEHLRRLGVDVIEHPFPDHHRFAVAELDFGDGLPVIMTEKDAVKCERLDAGPFWYLAVEARPEAGLGEQILKRLKETAGG
jgi:tetraacyldisaccharide 4'-kinase